MAVKLQAGSEPSSWPGPCFEVKEGGFLLRLGPAPPRAAHAAPPGPGLWQRVLFRAQEARLAFRRLVPWEDKKEYASLGTCHGWKPGPPASFQREGMVRSTRRGDPTRIAWNVVLIFVSNFRMNNSAAMPRLKYFSVFAKMWEKKMNFNEMFWFTLSEASRIIGCPRPKRTSAVLSSCLQKAKDRRVTALLGPLLSPISKMGRAPRR